MFLFMPGNIQLIFGKTWFSQLWYILYVLFLKFEDAGYHQKSLSFLKAGDTSNFPCLKWAL